MSPAERDLQKMKFRRLRTLRTANPFCATCGERRWWVPYELHHIAGRKNSDLTIRLCLNCHNGISLMQTRLTSLEDHPDPRRAELIAQLEGGALLHDLAAEKHREAADMLRGLPDVIPSASSADDDR